MELRPEKVIPAILLTTSLAIGSVACSNQDKPEPRTGTEQPSASTTTTETNNQNQGATQQETLNHVGTVEYFATQLEYAALRPDYRQEPSEYGKDAVTLLANRGVTLTNFNTRYHGQYGVVIDTASSLALLPCRLVEASGLKHITFLQPPEYTTGQAYIESGAWTDVPKTAGGAIEAEDPLEVSRAIAALVLENVPESKEVVTQFEAITKEAGVDYDPNFKVRYMSTSPFSEHSVLDFL